MAVAAVPFRGCRQAEVVCIRMTATATRRAQSRTGHDKDEGRTSHQVRSSHIITEHIDVAAPVEAAFDQWTQYDRWSEIFKRGGASARGKGVGSSRITVSSRIGPSERQWTADIVEVAPPRRIAWKSRGPVQAMGATTFHRMDDRLTRVMVEIEYDPRGPIEAVGNFLRVPRRRVRRDLRLFKHYLEMRGEATGRGPRRRRGDGLTAAVDGSVNGAGPRNRSPRNGSAGRRRASGSRAPNNRRGGN